MRRSAQILLVLMGGGMITAAGVAMFAGPECDPAQEQAGTCTSGSSTSSRSTYSTTTSYGHSGGGGTSGAVAGAAAGAAAGATAATIARGGFGGTGAARASSGG